MSLCPCGSGKNYPDCCEPLISGETQAQTPEALMRSRFTAHVKKEIDYLLQTTHKDKRDESERDSIRDWTEKMEWLSLEVKGTRDGGPDDEEGFVNFSAYFRKDGVKNVHSELAQFKKDDGIWYFYDGKAPIHEQFVRSAPKVGRNDPCPCGSNKKFKKCCG